MKVVRVRKGGGDCGGCVTREYVAEAIEDRGSRRSPRSSPVRVASSSGALPQAQQAWSIGRSSLSLVAYEPLLKTCRRVGTLPINADFQSADILALAGKTWRMKARPMGENRTGHSGPTLWVSGSGLKASRVVPNGWGRNPWRKPAARQVIPQSHRRAVQPETGRLGDSVGGFFGSVRISFGGPSPSTFGRAQAARCTRSRARDCGSV